jgi:hypothetical protein
LQGAEAGLAHDAFEHHAACDGCRVCRLGKGRLLLLTISGVQCCGPIGWYKIIWKRNAFFAHRGKLLAALCDEMVFVVLGCLRFSHDQKVY